MRRSITILVSASIPGRPAGFVVAPAGSLVVSDDKAGIIDRILFEGE